MARVIIAEPLFKRIHKTFSKSQANDIIDLLESLETYPKKGRELSTVGDILIKEMKYENYRFYCITDGHQIKFLNVEDLQDLLIKFVAMSDKKDQQKTIDYIKETLKKFGREGF